MDTNILILSQFDNSLGQMAKAIFKSFDKDLKIKSAATESAGILDIDAVKCMKSSGKDISRQKPKMVDEYLKNDWNYVLILNNSGDENIPEFKGKVNQYVFFEFEDVIGTDGTPKHIKEVYEKERKKMYDDLFNFYLKEFHSRATLGSDSCSQ